MYLVTKYVATAVMTLIYADGQSGLRSACHAEKSVRN
jgi:hypothetical protein